MKPERFKGEVLEGHKGAAVEVPFNPESKWKIPPRPLWRGRRGHRVHAKLDGASFDGFIVPRARRFFLLLDERVRSAAGLSAGDLVTIELTPVITS